MREPAPGAATAAALAAAPDASRPAAPLRVALLGANAQHSAVFAETLKRAVDALDRGSLQGLRAERVLLIDPQPADRPLATHDAALLLDHALPPQRDAQLREALAARRLPWSVVHGDGAAALEAALDALTFWLLRRRPSASARSGLFDRLDRRDAAQPAWRWGCDSCDSPECEHRSLAVARRSA